MMMEGQALVAKVRAAYGWTQQQLADELGTDIRNVGRWQRGEYQPSLRYYLRLQGLLEKAGRKARPRKKA